MKGPLCGIRARVKRLNNPRIDKRSHEQHTAVNTSAQYSTVSMVWRPNPLLRLSYDQSPFLILSHLLPPDLSGGAVPSDQFGRRVLSSALTELSILSNLRLRSASDPGFTVGSSGFSEGTAGTLIEAGILVRGPSLLWGVSTSGPRISTGRCGAGVHWVVVPSVSTRLASTN